jgi:hyperosmotically inducible protein
MKHVQLIPALTLIVMTLAFTGCDQQGPAEKAGEKIDQSMDSMQEKTEEAGEMAMDKLEEAGDKIEGATDQAADK